MILHIPLLVGTAIAGGEVVDGAKATECQVGSGSPVAVMEESPDIALPRAISGLQSKTQMHVETWQLDKSAWSVDLDRGVITFTNERGELITAPVQVIGTHDTRDNSFMWGWDHPSVPHVSAETAKLLKSYADANGIGEVSQQLVSLTVERAWELTALADYLAGSNGAYRGPVGTTDVYMTFGKVTISPE